MSQCISRNSYLLYLKTQFATLIRDYLPVLGNTTLFQTYNLIIFVTNKIRWQKYFHIGQRMGVHDLIDHFVLNTMTPFIMMFALLLLFILFMLCKESLFFIFIYLFMCGACMTKINIKMTYKISFDHNLKSIFIFFRLHVPDIDLDDNFFKCSINIK